jgi:hypothetical protein
MVAKSQSRQKSVCGLRKANQTYGHIAYFHTLSNTATIPPIASSAFFLIVLLIIIVVLSVAAIITL